MFRMDNSSVRISERKCSMIIQRIDPACRELADELIISRWFSLKMAVHGKEYDLHWADGFIALLDDAAAGVVTYHIMENSMEILSLDSLRENRGTGTALLNAAIREARERNCSRIMLITTNDNTNALRFYQKRGFDMAKIYRYALIEARKLKPSIPDIGMDGIPLKHEIELEMYL